MTALPDYPNEVVTKALVRLVRVPGLDQPAGIAFAVDIDDRAIGPDLSLHQKRATGGFGSALRRAKLALLGRRSRWVWQGSGR